MPIYYIITIIMYIYYKFVYYVHHIYTIIVLVYILYKLYIYHIYYTLLLILLVWCCSSPHRYYTSIYVLYTTSQLIVEFCVATMRICKRSRIVISRSSLTIELGIDYRRTKLLKTSCKI